MNVDTLSANGAGEWMKLPAGEAIVLISCASWSTSTVTLDIASSVDGTDPEPVYMPAGDAVFSASGSTMRSIVLISDGEMAVRPTVANYGGSPITVRVRSSVRPRI